MICTRRPISTSHFDKLVKNHFSVFTRTTNFNIPPVRAFNWSNARWIIKQHDITVLDAELTVKSEVSDMRNWRSKFDI